MNKNKGIKDNNKLDKERETNNINIDKIKKKLKTLSIET